MFTILAKEKDGVPKGPDPFGIPCESGIWYDIKEKKNLAKVCTPEVAAAIIEKVKGSCSQSAPLMEGSCNAPDDFEVPVIKIVKVDQLEVGGEMEDNMMIFIGKMFTVKELLKGLFDIKYGEIVFQGKNKTAWHNRHQRGRHHGHRGLAHRLRLGRRGDRLALVDVSRWRYPPRCF